MNENSTDSCIDGFHPYRGLLCTNHPDADVFNVTWTQWKELEYPAGFKEHLYTAARELPMTYTWKKLSLLPVMPSLKYTVSF